VACGTDSLITSLPATVDSAQHAVDSPLFVHKTPTLFSSRMNNTKDENDDADNNMMQVV